MPFLIPLFLGAGATGYWWWSSSKEEEPTFWTEAFDVLKPFLILITVLLLLRFLYKKGTENKAK